MSEQQNLKNLLKKVPKEIVEHVQHLERVRQDFIANVSHELRTPLTVLHGYLEVLLENYLSEDKSIKKIYQQMYQQTLRMENLISDLLLLSSLDRRESREKQHKLLNLNKLFQHIAEDMKILIVEKKHTIIWQLEGNLKLKGNEKELTSLFVNLISNAIKYTPENGKITVRCYLKAENLIFEVEDTGIGIEKHHLPRLTERFYRVDKARSRSSGGTGLGLAIVKHVLMEHHGELTVQSTPDVGSVFTCVFYKNYESS